ncbi:NADP-dependent isocitrate dehydrogenase [Candidatus Lucifugimonas marina]|uniref:Isocitrate dehydrogenase [NADP] n=1 Tax=Candidatus Lucifugimonas marina TaxID=3038979 RepID=A0AAJ6CTX3_9CHLR|nr:NADP-dependent isocitrate dehydrogenase [SAR202 cluster bacterium JH702]MDG0870362.1 NADP-dependent isocitrate dehydrogenase [SAR202 cluster bacterium JH639]WFG36082.1 NADP-dependent isocitrate dehydrogenase [SAR202 cluster bacterium JH545]WFG40027.1 NADP-dependent isocitrate dehydrogenase [SAR202 cluster bacterium JH1073]
MTQSPSIIYTWTDEAPALATHAFLRAISSFVRTAGVEMETRDISLAARVLAQFPEVLGDKAVDDDLAELGRLVELPEANIIKLPNISASTPQMKECIAELQSQGYNLPDYPDDPGTDAEKDALARYGKAMGSAVNPVLRQGNSDRRAPKAVKDFAKSNPGRMKDWPADSKSHVATMTDNDFFHNEKSVTIGEATTAKIEHVAKNGKVTTLMAELPLLAGEVLDATFMSRKALVEFFDAQVKDAKEKDILYSLHLKATMMKVSDPILFGHAVRTYFSNLFTNHEPEINELGANPNNGFGDVVGKLSSLIRDPESTIVSDIEKDFANGPGIAMVNSAKGITNLHVPSDVIIDASMPPMIRDGGQMWNANDELQDVKAVIPDSTYAGIFAATVEDCQTNGKLDPATMGSVPNVGLMAQKAQEYGSHDKTFEAESAGTIRIVDGSGATLLEHDVEVGDIWRACQTKDEPIKDWVKLAVRRARATGSPAIFWLDSSRGHDAEVIKKVNAYLPGEDTDGLDLRILAPVEAIKVSLERIRKGEDTISVTGNVLRDYLTDLFPILEIGTSARMLSVVPLLNGGGLFETGAGGSAPKHVEQFEEEGHLRWDSLGEYMALAASLQHLSEQFDNPGAGILGDALDAATGKYLESGRIPSRKVHEMDNRGSTFYLTYYWAEALAAQSTDPELAKRFAPVAAAMAENEDKIIGEINDSQGNAQKLGGYYRGDAELLATAMNPSATLNAIIDAV